MKIISTLLLTFLISNTFKANSALDNQTKSINCEKDSFKIELVPFLSNVDGLTITLFYKLNLSIPLPTDVTLIQYANECLDYVVFNLKSSNSQENLINQKPDKNLANLYIQFKDLNPLTKYDIKIGYQQKQPYSDIKYTLIDSKETCFDKPGPPTELKKPCTRTGKF